MLKVTHWDLSRQSRGNKGMVPKAIHGPREWWAQHIHRKRETPTSTSSRRYEGSHLLSSECLCHRPRWQQQQTIQTHERYHSQTIRSYNQCVTGTTQAHWDSWWRCHDHHAQIQETSRTGCQPQAHCAPQQHQKDSLNNCCPPLPQIQGRPPHWSIPEWLQMKELHRCCVGTTDARWCGNDK